MNILILHVDIVKMHVDKVALRGKGGGEEKYVPIKSLCILLRFSSNHTTFCRVYLSAHANQIVSYPDVTKAGL